jgi:hypothetical protein
MSILDRARRALAEMTGTDDTVSRLERRAQSLSSHELVSWTETNLTGIGRAFGDWQREGRPESLEEARLGTASAVIVLEELERRRQRGYL